MSLSKAYSSMKKHGHSMSSSDCKSCGGICKYSDGGQVMDPNKAKSAQDSMRQAFKFSKGGKVQGVHEEQGHGYSKAGAHASLAKELADKDQESGESEYTHARQKHNDEAVYLHKEKLSELKAMPKPKLQGLAKGGMVKGVHSDAVKGLNQKGMSKAGQHLRESHETSDRDEMMKREDKAKELHEEVLSQNRMINPKIKGLAHGGKVKGFDMDGPESKSFMEKGEFTSEAEGGEIDNELMDTCCDELMKSIQAKDKHGMLESLKAIILSVKG